MMKNILLIQFATAAIFLLPSSSNAQLCQTSYDYQDLMGDDYIHDRPFMCGTAMMEDHMFHERSKREEKGYYDIEGLSFYSSPGYYQKDGKLYYSTHPDTFKLIPNGDVESMKFVGNFVRDKNYIYVGGVPQTTVDWDSFEQIGTTPYAKDKNNVYFSASRAAIHEGSEIKIVKEAKPSYFEIVCDESGRYCHYYGKDDASVYFSGELMPEADAASFELADYGYSKDDNYVYYNGRKMERSSGSTFRSVDYAYKCDDNNVYYYGKIIRGLVGKNFRLLGDTGMGSDGVRICSGENVFPESEPSSFVDLGCGYSKDANNVYTKGQVVDFLDPDSFQILDWGFTKDKNGVYCDIEIIPGADPTTFEVLGRKYAWDSKNVFYLRNTLEECDRNSFVVDSADENLARDGKATYVRGKRTPKIGNRSFNHI